MPSSNFRLSLGLAAAAAAAFALPGLASAQPAPDEDIVVTGRYGTVPDSVRSLSQPVSYADLDLSTQAGRDILRQRVRLTARFLCEKLGESDSGSPIAPSCRDAASRDALARVGKVEQGFAPRGTTWVAPSPWAAPYPADWADRYRY